MRKQTYRVNSGRFTLASNLESNSSGSESGNRFNLKGFELADYSLSYPNRSGPKVSQLIRKGRKKIVLKSKAQAL